MNGKTILIPTDFSKAAQNAFDYAANMFGSDHHYILLHAYDLPQVRASRLSNSDHKRAHADSDQLLEQEAVTIRAQYPEIDLSVISAYGDCNTVINELKTENPVDLVVMGATGKTGVKKIILGSISQEALRTSKYPVLTVPANHSFSKPHNITFAADLDDLIENSEYTLLRELAEHFKTHVTLLHLYHSEDGKPDAEAIKNKLLKLKIPGTSSFNTNVVRHKKTAEGIDRYVTESSTDLLVLKPKKKGFFRDLFRTKVSTELECFAQLPVLALK